MKLLVDKLPEAKEECLFCLKAGDTFHRCLFSLGAYDLSYGCSFYSDSCALVREKQCPYLTEVVANEDLGR